MRAWLAISAIAVAGRALAEPITGYTVFELRPAVLDESVPNPKSYTAVVSKLNENVSAHCGGKIAEWNANRAPNAQRLSLAIEPHITKIKFVGGNARFWLGPLKGNSDIFSIVKIVDAATGQVLAEESFRGHGNGFKGMVTIGTSDNLMIVKVATDICDYVLHTITPGAPTVDAQAQSSIDSTIAGASDDLYAQLLKLDDLRKRGILTEAEFQSQKQKLLNDASLKGSEKEVDTAKTH